MKRIVMRAGIGCAAGPILVCLVVCVANAQLTQKKAFPFRGTVEQVHADTRRLTVHTEPIEGWMGEMTMSDSRSTTLTCSRT